MHPISALASYQDTTGATLLYATTTNLNGAGVRVAQAEVAVAADAWQVNPSVAGRTNGFITYYSNAVFSASSFPNSVGTESFHANGVGTNFYALADGMARGVSHVDNYEANYFVSKVYPVTQPFNAARIVNQSFSFGSQPTNIQENYDSAYDNFAAANKVILVNAVGNSGTVALPATSYNGIGVGAYNGGTATGPTPDNGRAKPDITAPADATSFSTPQVSGAAAILLQAAVRGDAGADTNSAGDIRTVKALLLNGAIKPSNWSAPKPSPLDPLYGAGVLNVFNSYRQFIGGKHTNTGSTNINLGAAHPPISTTNSPSITNLSGWDFATLTSSTTKDAVGEYHFVLPTNATATITLAWNRQQNQTTINNLYLYLYKIGNAQPVASSTSTVDNVQHIYSPNLSAGQYALQILKPGGATTVSAGETYALAYEFVSQKLTLTRGTNGTIKLTWPIYPAGFTLESTSTLASGSWSSVTATPLILSNSLNQVTLTPSAGIAQYYRLRRP